MGFKIENNVLVKYIDEGEKDIVIPFGIIEIKDSAFAECENIETVEISNHVRTIGEGAFFNCQNMKNIKIPDSIEIIGKDAFSNCKNLSHIKIPDKIKFIEPYTFSNCERLKTFNVPCNVVSIGELAFENCTSLVSVTLPESLQYLENGVFRNCVSLERIKIPDGVREIKTGTFYNCKKLKSLVIPASVKKIGRLAFSECYNIKDITISSEMSIEMFAFERFKDIENITITDRVSSITLHKRAYNLDFSDALKFMRGDLKVKKYIFQRSYDTAYVIPLVMYLAYAVKDKEADEYVRENTVEVARYFIDNEEDEHIIEMLKSGYITEENIDEIIKYAIYNKKAIIEVILMNYKRENFGFRDNFDNFMLD